MPHVQDDVGQRQTRAFIDRDPSDTVVVRRTLQATPHGGFTWHVDATLAPQVFRFIPVRSINAQQVIRTTPDGRQVLTNWYIVCMPSDMVDVGDILQADGKTYEVIFENEVPSWRKVMEVLEDAD